MHETGASDGGWMSEIDDTLHDLCQPLTALQCRLELGGIEGEGAAKQTAIEEALRECRRVNERVHAMQSVLRSAMRAH
jgi:hypothetical protein